MKQVLRYLRNGWLMLSDIFQLIQNMGWRYIVFRAGYEFQKIAGILKFRFPVNPPTKKFIPLEEWQNRPVPFFFQDQLLSFNFNQDYELLKKRIDALHRHEFLFFGSKWYMVPDWLTNPESGFSYDISKHWSEIPDFSLAAGDIKYVWEKSRFTFLYDLIRYDFHFEKDQAAFVFSEIESWIDHNPVNCGPNWRCSQEITLRVLNWTFALQYYKNSSSLNEPLFSKIINSIYQQMCHVAENIHFSRIAVRNNHALTETLGLYLVGLIYPFFEESSVWKKNGKKWFEEEIAYQIYEDGTFIQFSMNYHRVAVQLLTWGIQLAHLNQESWNEVVYDRARKSLHFLLTCQDSKTGQLPNYGNNDGALFFPLTECHFRDFRPQLLALANVLGEEVYYGKGACQEGSFWLGSTQREMYVKDEAVKKPLFSAFPKGGYYILREQKTITFLRCGSYQNRPFQSDNLHIDIWVEGENILRDAGSYQYNTDKKWTDYFSGTASHNTIMLGDYDQMRKGGRFIWYDWIKKSNGDWKSEDDKFIFEGYFEGFKELGKKIIHRRKVTKSIGAPHWIIEDWVENAPDGIAMNQIWHPSQLFFDQYNLKAFSKKGEEVKYMETDGWYSGTYGERESTRRVVFSTTERYIKTEINLILKEKIEDAHFTDPSVFS
jgi:hypothetical protein